MFIGGVGTTIDEEPGNWAKMIENLGLGDSEYAFFDWDANSPYRVEQSTNALLNSEITGRLAKFLEGKKDITLVGHSKGGDLILEYLAEIAGGNERLVNTEVKQAFILDSPTEGELAKYANLRRYTAAPPGEGPVLRDRFRNLGEAVSSSTRGQMTVDIAMIANQRDPISGPPIPGIPYFSYKSGNEQWGEVFLVGGFFAWLGVKTIHGNVQNDSWPAGFIAWCRQG